MTPPRDLRTRIEARANDMTVGQLVVVSLGLIALGAIGRAWWVG